jgi:hypothetical protein
MSKVRILTPSFEADDQELLASFRGMDGSRLKEKKIRLGLFDNTKPNAGLLLEKIGEELSKTGVVRNIVSVTKAQQFSNPAASEASPELLDRLAEGTDFVIVGLGN